MRANDHANLVLLEEPVDDIRTVAHDVVDSGGIANGILLHAENFVRDSWITPKNIHAHLLNSVCDAAQVDSQRSLNLIDVVELGNRVTNSTVRAQDTILSQFILNDCAERHPFEQIIHFLEHTVWLINILVKSLGALLAKSKILVDVSVLVITTQQEDLSGVLEFESKQKAENLETLATTIDIVS